MAKKTALNLRVIPAAEKLAAQLDFELVEVELAQEAAGRFLRFFIDKPGGISLDDLESFHRKITPATDDIDFDYMEVSSPGADRPLKTPEQFRRAEGTRVEVRLYKPLEGRKVWVGELCGLIDDAVVVEVDGQRVSFGRRDVAKVAPAIDVSESEMQEILGE